MDKSIEQMRQDLASTSYAKSTQKKYLKAAPELAESFGRPVTELGRDELRAYVEHLRGQARSASWLKGKLAGVVFLYAKTLGRPMDVSFVAWPTPDAPLPPLLSLYDVAPLL